MPSPFDISSFMQEHTYDATAIDYKWHNVPDGGYMAQLKEFARGAEMDADKFNGRAVISSKIAWIVMDEDVKRELGLQEVAVQQDILIERVGPTGPIDWGTNKNMGLKHLMVATETNNNKKFNLSHLLGQVAWITVKNEPRKGGDPETLFSNVKKVEPLAAGRAAYEAAQAKAAA
jgi:hypothetical protein